MKVTFVRWKDACSVEAADLGLRPAVPELSELCEVGFLLADMKPSDRDGGPDGR